jgi:putative hydrolase of the HAD superfamily
MIKTVILDLNGVLIKGPKLSEVFRDKFGVQPAEFLSVLTEVMSKIRLPYAGDSFKYWQPHLQEWGINIGREEFFDLWFSSEKEAPEMVALAKELKNQGLKILIFSNNFVERAEYYDKNFPFLKEIFDKIYYSWQTGLVKPDPRAFGNLLAKENLEPEECLYFDDKQENVEVAKNLGIRAFLFEGAERVREIALNETKYN